MLDWLKSPATAHNSLEADDLAVRLCFALVFGGIIAGIYALTQRKSRAEMVPMATTLVLLTVLIAMVTLIIGNNVARAFSLAGALAIIRFRTVVEDTRDTAFVIFSVVVGMSMGADPKYVLVSLIGIPIVAVAALSLSFFKPSNSAGASDYSLAIRLGLGRDPNSVLKDVFAKHLTSFHLRATTTARQGSALDLDYVVKLRAELDATTLVLDLNQIEGVQNVELRQL